MALVVPIIADTKITIETRLSMIVNPLFIMINSLAPVVILGSEV
jgi:hypothetical protein